MLAGEGERVVSVLAYNHAVRSSAARDRHFRSDRETETQTEIGPEGGYHEECEEVLRDSKAQRKAYARTAGRRQRIISDVHTDFTRNSGITLSLCVSVCLCVSLLCVSVCLYVFLLLRLTVSISLFLQAH